MSLDFFLIGEEEIHECVCDKCSLNHTTVYSPTLFDINISHNLTEMADKAGLYQILWRPQENGYVYARDIIEALSIGIDKLKADSSYYRKFNPPTSWGTYEGFLKACEDILKACREFPTAIIEVCT